MMTLDDFLSAQKIDKLTVDEKRAYFEELKEFVLSLPFDEAECKRCEQRYLNKLKLYIPAFNTILKPNISTRLEEKPKSPFVLISNHLDSCDPLLLFNIFSETPLHFMIAESFLKPKNRWLGKFYIRNGAYVIDRTTPVGRIMGIINSLQYVWRGYNIAMFPEGSRKVHYGSDGSVQDFKQGAAMISQVADISIAPMAINNDFKRENLYANVGELFNVRIEDKIVNKNIELQSQVSDLWEENRKNGAKIYTKKKKY